MISLERIDKAIELCNKKIADIPPDELVPENRDYMKWEQLLKGLKSFRESFAKIDKLLTDVGV